MIYYIILYCDIMHLVLFYIIIIGFAKNIVHKAHSCVLCLLFNCKCIISLFQMNLSQKIIHKPKISLFGN